MWPAPLACLTLGLLGGALDAPDLDTLVRQLGSPRFAEREAASTALLDLGREAVPILRQARRQGDAEVQARAVLLLDTIDRQALRQPTRLTLEPGDRSLGLLVRQLADRTGFELEPGRNAAPGRDVTVEADPGAPAECDFWEAVDRAGLEPEWSAREPQRFGAPSPGQTLRLSRTPAPPATHANSGPFRLVAIRPQGSRPRGNVTRLDQAPDAAEGGEPFDLKLELMAEPRLRLKPGGVVQVLEASDERGNDLLGTGGSDRPQASREANATAAPVLPLTIGLFRPAQEARQLERLRVRIPVQLEARKSDPIEIDLSPGAVAPGPVWAGDGFLIVHGLIQVPGRDIWRLELTLQPENWQERPQGRFGGQRRMPFDPLQLDRMWSSVELIDRHGQRLNPALGRSARMGPDGFQIALEFPTANDAPTLLRYQGVIREPADLVFELRNVPLPASR